MGDHHVPGRHAYVDVTHPCQALPLDEVLDLLRVAVTMDVVAGVWRERGDSEHALLRPATFAGNHPLHGHVHPPLVRPVREGGRHVGHPHLLRMGVDDPSFWSGYCHLSSPT